MLSISSYFSAVFLLGLLPITLILYAVFPQKLRRIVLLLSSYVFFWAVSGKLIVYLLISTLGVHYFGLWISEIQRDGEERLLAVSKEERKSVKAQEQRRQRKILAFGVIFHLAFLIILKYTPFFTENFNSLLQTMGMENKIPVPEFALPIGISFYTFQAISYLFDVYRRQIPADRNLLRLAMYMSFFPQIMEGPICRYGETAAQLWEAPKLQYQNLIMGGQRILWGAMKKIVIADRLNLFIQNVFNGYPGYDGLVIAAAAIGYTIQLYADFSGTMDLVIGTGELFGIILPENFRRPFASATISEFWQRWHITLGAWFKDYIFYPVSMAGPVKRLSKKVKKRYGRQLASLLTGAVALFCVWISNGLWHGAGWNYIFFGMYHFALILTGNILDPYVIKLNHKLGISRSGKVYHWLQIIRTWILVCIGELFFRAHGFHPGIEMFVKIFRDFSLESVRNGSILNLGMDIHDVRIVAVSVLILFAVGILQEKGIHIRQKLSEQHIAVRYAAVYAIILFIVIFGAYGAGYMPVDPMYANF